MAGLLAALTGSRYPDLVIGFVIGLIVLNGARRILQLKSRMRKKGNLTRYA